MDGRMSQAMTSDEERGSVAIIYYEYLNLNSCKMQKDFK